MHIHHTPCNTKSHCVRQILPARFSRRVLGVRASVYIEQTEASFRLHPLTQASEAAQGPFILGKKRSTARHSHY